MLWLCACAPEPATSHVPWACQQTHRITQGQHIGSHVGAGRHAWDFDMREGEWVVAHASGQVRRVKQDSSRHGCSDAFAEDGNYVVLTQPGGLEALYLHLQAGSVQVQVGESVARGARLGRVGKSGKLCGSLNQGVHLHFQLQRPCEGWLCASVPGALLTQELATGELVSRNCAAPLSAPSQSP